MVVMANVDSLDPGAMEVSSWGALEVGGYSWSLRPNADKFIPPATKTSTAARLGVRIRVQDTSYCSKRKALILIWAAPSPAIPAARGAEGAQKLEAVSESPGRLEAESAAHRGGVRVKVSGWYGRFSGSGFGVSDRLGLKAQAFGFWDLMNEGLHSMGLGLWGVSTPRSLPGLNSEGFAGFRV